ncbi:MAG: amidinotransferase [Anaerolineae bacterium]|nr:MAG: amidinotransferase [Anaerolineae bacterium]
MDTSQRFAAAYGGAGWSPRRLSHRQEIGSLWAACGQDSEYAALKAVLLHAPGDAWERIEDPNSLQMLDRPDYPKARRQHAALAAAYQQEGVQVHYVQPAEPASPNLIFCADLLFATPEGVILARPASTVRAGEERWVARRLADLGIPILKTLHGHATFEGADAAWLDPQTVLIGRGLRTNAEGAAQVSAALAEIGVESIVVDMPVGTMHLMGMLRFLDRDLAVAWPYRLAWQAVEALEARGYRVVYLPDEDEAIRGHALNFVTLGPRRILMAAGNPKTEDFYRQLGVTVISLELDELLKAAGGAGCMTGILQRTLIHNGD